MTSRGQGPNDAFDPFETRLAKRVARHAEGGVRPIDAGAMAHAAAIAGGRQGRAGLGALARVGWLLAGAALAVGAIGGIAWAGSHGLLGVASPTEEPSFVAVVPTEPVPTAAAPSPTLVPTLAPTPTPAPTKAPVVACVVTNLSAKVTGWAGAAGNRVGTIVLTNDGAVPCQLATMERPQLVDGNHTVLLDGDDPTSTDTILVAPGATVSTMVDDANYCGSAPAAPVTVAFVFANGDKLTAAAKSATDMSGLPDCLGPGGPGLMTMHPWAP